MTGPGASGGTQEKERRRRRGSRRSRRPGATAKGPLSPQQRLGRAIAELGQAVEALAKGEGVSAPPELEIVLAVGPASPEVWSARTTAAEVAILDQLRALRPLDIVWRDGAVFCFQCREIGCRHARPDTDLKVFAGYSATGKPTWRPFVGLCLEQRIAGLDRLYERPPGVVALVQMAEALSEDVLPGFSQGQARYNVVGQVAVGLIPVSLRRGDQDRVAVTLQVVERRLPNTPVQLRLNLIGLRSDHLAQVASEGAERSEAERLRRAVLGARRRLGEAGRRVVVAEARREAYDLRGAVERVLNHLRGDIERAFDPEQRRTAHGRVRHNGGERPTSQAFGDARKASAERLFVDTHRHTVVVIGKRNRAHVFTHHGRHVTSLRLAEGELTRKTTRGRWAPLEPAAISAFRIHLEAENS